MFNNLGNFVLKHPTVVIGSSLNSLAYCYLNNLPFLSTKDERPWRFDYFEPEQDLSFFGLKNKSRKLISPTGEKCVGIEKNILWERLYFELSLQGLNPIVDKAYSMRLEDNIIKVSTKNSRTMKISFDNLVIFNSENIIGLPPSKHFNKKYKVCDWINVKSGKIHPFDFIKTDDNFINEILFYPLPQKSAKKKNMKNAVAISYLTEKELSSFECSDINARFKVLQLMKGAGIKGRKNGIDARNKSRHYHYAVNVEVAQREKTFLEVPYYDSINNIKFNYDSFNDIINILNV